MPHATAEAAQRKRLLLLLLLSRRCWPAAGPAAAAGLLQAKHQQGVYHTIIRWSIKNGASWLQVDKYVGY
jgi:hypothetical protein